MRYVAAVVIAVVCCSPLLSAPPKAPAGYKWVANAAFSDEFNGESLDTTKWHDHHPRWKGRPPAKFVPDTVSLKDGKLQIRNRVMDPPEGPFNIAGGAVVSKSEQAFYGYYEVKMKASKISMSSTFWFSNRGERADGGNVSHELDVHEAVGGGKRHPDRKNFMKSNTHYWLRKDGKRYDEAVSGQAKISPPDGDAYHVFAVWWIDANTMKFYHNDKYVFTIRPSTKFDKTPFDRPMHMNLVTETYDWETPPTPEELNDDTINTTYYDWVRSYVLVKEEPKPNIVLFFVDDMGWSDLGHRNNVFESPNIDTLAKEGLRFEQAYIACPTCSPSRATLLTGKHPARLKLVRHIPHDPAFGFDKFGRTDQRFSLWKTDPAKFPCVNWLDLEHTSYAEALKELGYYNLFIGKWHLGHEKYHPIHQGFDRQIGVTNWGHPRSYHPPYFKNSDVLADEKEQYLTDKLTDEAVEFIEQYDEDKPFMLSFWYYNVHGPHQGRKDHVKHFEDKGLTGRYANYAAMVKSVDESVGRVRDAIKDKGMADNTVIIFLSDQGGYFENPPLRGGKRVDTLYEGGARVPFIVHWPGVTKPGTTNNSVVQSTDLLPTLVEIAGGDSAEFEDLDGVSLTSTISKNSVLDRGEPIYGYRAYEDLYASVRKGPWKLLAYRSGTLKLYNIADDFKEQHDLAKSRPEKVKELRAALVKWEKEMDVEQYSGVQ